MKLMIASDIHGSAYYCSELLDAFEREQADKLVLLTSTIQILENTSSQWFDSNLNRMILGRDSNGAVRRCEAT